MKRVLLTAAMILAGTAGVSAAELTITIIPARPGGEIRAMLFRDAASFARRADPAFAFVLPHRDGTVTETIPNLPAGRYAVAVFQDENGNRNLDTGLFGQPVEPYGFSNNARNPFSAPDFDAAAFDLGSNDYHVITIDLD